MEKENKNFRWVLKEENITESQKSSTIKPFKKPPGSVPLGLLHKEKFAFKYKLNP